jgi:DNA-binding NtrC family response regulator
VPVEVPSLAKRREDIPSLVASFIERCSEAYKLSRVIFEHRALEWLISYS